MTPMDQQSTALLYGFCAKTSGAERSKGKLFSRTENEELTLRKSKQLSVEAASSRGVQDVFSGCDWSERTSSPT